MASLSPTRLEAAKGALRTFLDHVPDRLKVGLIAERECDLYINLSPRTKFWDTCAPQVILEEAGGRLTDLFGEEFRYDIEDVQNHVLRLIGAETVVVPGHGAPTDRDFVVEQHRQLSDLAWLIRAAHTGGATPERVAAEAPFGARAALVAARRGFAELDGTA